MKLKYLRVKILELFLPIIQKYTRKKRMRLFQEIISPVEGMKILDLGGQPEIWDYITPVLNITCLNLPGIHRVGHITHHNIKYVEGNACSMPEFKYGDFDIVFSNSVIEHVGNEGKRLLFANEIQRLSKIFWVQTPSKYYPIEAHCGMPFWWFYTDSMRAFFLKRWSEKLPNWAEMVRETAVISKDELKVLFPNGHIVNEYLLFQKSIIVYSVNFPVSA